MNLSLMLAVTIVAQPSVNPDVLEPSLRNEVDHALSRAPTNEIAVSVASMAFSALWATNGLSATDCAVRLVSSQRCDGRWIFHGGDVTPVAVRQLRQIAGYPQPPLKLSIFASHIEEIARQEKIPFATAAAKIRALGIDGIAVFSPLSAENLAEIRRQGFTVSGAIARMSFENGYYNEALCNALISCAVSNDSTQVMLVLKDRPKGDPRGSCAVGSGEIPIAEIISSALDAGYNGWFTIEHFGVTNMLECAVSSARFLRMNVR